jgi:hypothetical protein
MELLRWQGDIEGQRLAYAWREKALSEAAWGPGTWVNSTPHCPEFLSSQYIGFSENWIWRELPAVLVISPKPGPAATLDGRPKVTMLKILKNWARNWRVARWAPALAASGAPQLCFTTPLSAPPLCAAGQT